MPVAHPLQHGLPGLAHVGLGGVWQAETFQGAELEVLVHRNLRPPLPSDPLGLDGLPDVDEPVSGDHDVLAISAASHLVSHAGFLGSGDEVVDEHSQSMPGARLELGDDSDQVVHTAHVFHDDPDVAQVVSPDLLDEFGVVTTLDVDAAGKRNAGWPSRSGNGPRRRVLDAGTALTRGDAQIDGLAVHPETRTDGEGLALALAILEHDQAVLPRDDGPDVSARWILDDHVEFQWHIDACLHVRGAPATCEDVVGIPVDHGSHCIATHGHDDKPCITS